jgi:hypothetical protein
LLQGRIDHVRPRDLHHSYERAALEFNLAFNFDYFLGPTLRPRCPAVPR